MKHHSKTGKVKDRHTATPFIHHEQTHYHSLNTDSSLVRMHHGGGGGGGELQSESETEK